jgi:S-adenosylmethionine:tRNA ribosyltransferase-isomerase
MLLSEFSYNLPKKLIAQQPASPRDHSRLLVLDRASGHIAHRHFFDLPEFLKPGDVLVLNDTKVFPARLIGKKAGSGGKIEVFLLKKIKNGIWQCLVGGKSRQTEQKIVFSRKLQGWIMGRETDGTWSVRFNLAGKKFKEELERIGSVPLPPYIKRGKPEKTDKMRYQTIYADARHADSVAAPTAGLHFTPRLLKKLEAKGVKIIHLTLHVGLGTFLPVKTENIKEHKMHEEYYEIEKKTLDLLWRAKLSGKRVIAVGTTSTRVLETVFSKFPISPANGTPPRRWQFPKKSKIQNPKSKIVSGWTDIFIYPGYKFRAVDALVTNFHLPESTLLMLVAAFAGRPGKKGSDGTVSVKKAYAQAIKKNYRFFSYGDAMLIA